MILSLFLTDNGSKSEKWKSVTGSFAALNITAMSSACPKSQDGLSPTAHLADGTADLIIVQKCSTLQFLKYLNRHTNGKDQVREIVLSRRKAEQFSRVLVFAFIQYTHSNHHWYESYCVCKK